MRRKRPPPIASVTSGGGEPPRGDPHAGGVEPIRAPRRRRDRELWAGVLVLVGIAAVLWVLFNLTDASALRGRYPITTVVDQAGGIRRGDPVELRGVHIGRVRGFRIGREGVEIRLEIEGEYEIPRDSRVEVRSSGLLGGMAAEVIPGVAREPIASGASIPGTTRESLPDVAGRVATESDELVQRMQSLLSKRTVEGVETSSVELAEMLKELSAGAAEQRRELGALTKSLRRSAKNLEGATGPELARSVARLDAMTARLEKLTPEVERTVGSLGRSSRSVEAVMGRLERGEGTLGRALVDDTLYRNADAAARSLQQASAELGKLASDVRANPKRYVKLSVF